MAIERFVWTTHADYRRKQRMIDRATVEQTIRDGHGDRELNGGRADWRIHGLLADGRRLGIVYDHPHGTDRSAVRIVSVWDY